MNTAQKNFIKRNAEMLSDIYSEKISSLMTEVLDATENRNEKIEVINILRNWLREIEMVKKGQDFKKTTFI